MATTQEVSGSLSAIYVTQREIGTKRSKHWQPFKKSFQKKSTEMNDWLPQSFMHCKPRHMCLKKDPMFMHSVYIKKKDAPIQLLPRGFPAQSLAGVKSHNATRNYGGGCAALHARQHFINVKIVVVVLHLPRLEHRSQDGTQAKKKFSRGDDQALAR